MTDPINPEQVDARQRKALEVAIGYPLVHASWTDAEGAHGITTHMAIQDRDALVACILAAGFTTKGDQG